MSKKLQKSVEFQKRSNDMQKRNVGDLGQNVETRKKIICTR